jgi:hypothetical protein
MGGVSYYTRHFSSTSTFLKNFGILLSLWFVLGIGWRFWRKYINYRSLVKSGEISANLDNLIQCSLPAWIYPYFQAEKKIYGGCWRAICRKPILYNPTYPVVNGEKYNFLIPILIIGIVFDLPVASLIVAVTVKSSLVILLVDCIFIFFSLYGIIWIIGDLRNIKESGHKLSSSELSLNLGVRCKGNIPIDLIDSCCEISGSFIDYCNQKSIPSDKIWRVSPLDKPNVVIDLKSISTLNIIRFEYPTTICIKWVALYIDDSQRFSEDISRIILKNN